MLDLTRVIAGPTATKVLAAVAAADVLRLDAPGFEEVPALVADTSAGKRCARLDLRDSRVESLVAAADVLVCGLRPGALARLGLDAGAARAGEPVSSSSPSCRRTARPGPGRDGAASTAWSRR